MSRFIIAAYGYFNRHRPICWSVFAVVSILLTCSLSRLNYNEDISDFLPLDEENQTALAVYQQTSGANNVYAIISTSDNSTDKADLIVEVADRFVQLAEEADSAGILGDIIAETDLGQIAEVSDFVYSNMPLFLTDEDYARIDSLLANDEYVAEKLREDKELLMFPSSSMVGERISHDPLGLFTPVMERLTESLPFSNSFDSYDGHFLSADHTRGFVIVNSNFGSSESDMNRQVLNLLQSKAREVENEMPQIRIALVGAPAVAVANADRIKTDSLWGLLVAAVLIVALLLYVFRTVKNILLIFLSVGWGWLFALGIIGLFYDSVSLIVIGISSIIVGIAINYPLHLIDHLKDRADRPEALKEIVSPLVVGNVTTVGAFMALIPLDSKALHDLGLFSALLLAGTILFVIFILPHLLSPASHKNAKHGEPALIGYLCRINPSRSKITVGVIIALTAVFGVFALRTEFDSDLRNINYIPEKQKDELRYLEQIFKHESSESALYVVSSGADYDDAISKLFFAKPTIDSLVSETGIEYGSNVGEFLIPQSEQQRRLDRWTEFREAKADALTSAISGVAPNVGFSQQAFLPFEDIVRSDYHPVEFDGYAPLTSTIFARNIARQIPVGEKFVLTEIKGDESALKNVKSVLDGMEGIVTFDVGSMNESITRSLTDDFNYVGFVCGAIVFIFLWISMRSLRLAAITFLPMMIGWVWILGIMGILGIQFNIVNVILATFIFGQGDDYTIFITEGLVYEHKHRRPMLASYKGGVVVSALIMFIGIGVLAFAQHPALRSLGLVTIIGMATVVFMAYTIPPLLFGKLYGRN